KVKVNVILEDRESNKLIFSRKPKEKGDAVARKKNLMAKLSVGDVETKFLLGEAYILLIHNEVEDALLKKKEVEDASF
ncbi:hypothetical protein Tco_0946182, partial [Tanacetum coccineum]